MGGWHDLIYSFGRFSRYYAENGLCRARVEAQHLIKIALGRHERQWCLVESGSKRHGKVNMAGICFAGKIILRSFYFGKLNRWWCNLLRCTELG